MLSNRILSSDRQATLCWTGFGGFRPPGHPRGSLSVRYPVGQALRLILDGTLLVKLLAESSYTGVNVNLVFELFSAAFTKILLDGCSLCFTIPIFGSNFHRIVFFLVNTFYRSILLPINSSSYNNMDKLNYF